MTIYGPLCFTYSWQSAKLQKCLSADSSPGGKSWEHQQGILIFGVFLGLLMFAQAYSMTLALAMNPGVQGWDPDVIAEDSVRACSLPYTSKQQQAVAWQLAKVCCFHDIESIGDAVASRILRGRKTHHGKQRRVSCQHVRLQLLPTTAQSKK
eukprot:4582198-Amphidinium_carterae.1